MATLKRRRGKLAFTTNHKLATSCGAADSCNDFGFASVVTTGMCVLTGCDPDTPSSVTFLAALSPGGPSNNCIFLGETEETYFCPPLDRTIGIEVALSLVGSTLSISVIVACDGVTILYLTGSFSCASWSCLPGPWMLTGIGGCDGLGVGTAEVTLIP